MISSTNNSNNFCPCGKKRKAKQITVFINGQKYAAKKVLVSATKWHHVLSEITSKLQPDFGPIKKLYSSESGITLNSFSELENEGAYVASNNKKFQLVEGGYIDNRLPIVKYFQHYVNTELKRKNKNTKLAYVRRDLICIYIYTNGKPNYVPKKIVLNNEDLVHWEQTLSYIALAIDNPGASIKSLYNVNGSKVCGPWELQHGASYVAVGYHEKFKSENYANGEEIREEWKNGVPFVNKHKNLPCWHKPRMTWEKKMKWNHYSDGLQDYNLYKQFSNKITRTWNDAQDWRDYYTANSKNCGCHSSRRSQFTISTKNSSHSGRIHTAQSIRDIKFLFNLNKMLENTMKKIMDNERKRFSGHESEYD